MCRPAFHAYQRPIRRAGVQSPNRIDANDNYSSRFERIKSRNLAHRSGERTKLGQRHFRDDHADRRLPSSNSAIKSPSDDTSGALARWLNTTGFDA